MRPYMVMVGGREPRFYVVYATFKRTAERKVRAIGPKEASIAIPHDFESYNLEFDKAKTTGRPVYIGTGTSYRGIPPQWAVDRCRAEGGKVR